MDPVKYPRSFHLPFSPGATSDDKTLQNTDHFEGQNVVVTVKMDGENTTLYRDYMHARSLTYDHHPSRSMMRAQHAAMKHLIPENMRVCGENLYARHSIEYQNLTAHFQVFSIWEIDRCLSWADTVEWAALLGLQTVPVLYQGMWDEKAIKALYKPTSEDGDTMEGYVVRLAGSFEYAHFSRSLAKFVRANHVQTDQHWKAARVVPNGLLR